MSYRKVLVLSDNLFLCREFRKLWQDENLSSIADVTFMTSPPSLSSFRANFDPSTQVLNLKEPQQVAEIISQYDLVLSIHCKQLFPPELVKAVKCINVHPGYNPLNRGWFPQVFALKNQGPIGATIHEIDELLDHGAIIDRAFLEYTAWDTSLTVYNRILALEISLLRKNLRSILQAAYHTIAPESEGVIYYKSDFNKLCHLDLNQRGTYASVIDHLRALSFGDLRNAYFIDPKSGKKVFVHLKLEVDE